MRERPFTSGKRYVAHVDPSGGAARRGHRRQLYAGHRTLEKDIATLDCLREVKPPFSPEAVTQSLARRSRAYGVRRVVGDRYAGEWPREQFRKAWRQYQLADRSASDYYRDALPLLNSRRVDLLDNQRLIAQLVGLERRVGRSGKDQISHRVGSHDDLANSAAACLCAATKPRDAWIRDVPFLGKQMSPGDIVQVSAIRQSVMGTRRDFTHDRPDGTRWRCVADSTSSHRGRGRHRGGCLPAFLFRNDGDVSWHARAGRGRARRLCPPEPIARPKHELADGGRVDFGPRYCNAARVHLIVENLGRFL